MSGKNILITGGAGFIGSNLSLELIKKGYNLTILDNLSEQIHGENPKLPKKLYEKVNFINGDVRDKNTWYEALDNQEIVVHLAAETGTGQSMYEIQKYSEVNLIGTANMLDILTNDKHSVEKVIVASSRAIYGEGKYDCEKCGVVYPKERKNEDMKKGKFDPKCPKCGGSIVLAATDEESKKHPTSVYGITKQNQEDMVLTVCKSLGIPGVAFRYQNVYGPGQSLSNPYTGILSIFSTRIKNGNDINIFEDGKESRDFVYIDDVVSATILGIEKAEANYQAFNVGSGERTDVLTIAKKLREKYNSDIEIRVSGDYRLGDIRHNYADLSKIQNKLGYEPKFNFEKGISNFVKWVENQTLKEDNYEKSIDELKSKGLYK